MVGHMNSITSIKDLIASWPSRKALAVEIDVSVDRIHKWVQTESIPARFHARLLRSAAAQGISLTADDLARLHDRDDAGEVAA